jgi:hypothetical protein
MLSQMSPFPEEWELIAFFQGAPTLLDWQNDWAYNRLTFTTKRGDDEIACAIEPGEYLLQLQWSRGGHELLSLDFRTVRGITLEISRDKEVLVAQLEDHRSLPFRLQLKPHVHVFWATRES